MIGAGGRPPEVWCPIVCGVAKSAAKSGFQEVVGALANGAQYMLKFMATFWMKVPDPQVSGGGKTGTAAQLAALTNDQYYVVMFFGIIGFLAGLIRLVWDNRHAQSTKELVRGFVVMTVATGLTLPITQALLDAGNAYSPWILQQATGASNGKDAFAQIIEATLVSSNQGDTNAVGAWFILAILLILGALVQVVFMIVRGAVIYCLMVFLPYTTCTAYSEEGWGRFKRVAMLLFAFTVYKPVAATIYATGFKVLHTPTDPDKTLNSLMTGVYGLTILVLAALALPALIKFLMPMAALGSSSAFSGGAALAAIGTGAAMIATGGGSAAAAGGSGAAAGGGAGLTQTGGSGGPMGSPSGGGDTGSGGGGGTGASQLPGSGSGGTSQGSGTGGEESSGTGSGAEQTSGSSGGTGGGMPSGGTSGAGGSGSGSGGSGSGGSSGGRSGGSGSGQEQTQPIRTGGSTGAGGSGATGSGSTGSGGGGKAAELVGAALQHAGQASDEAIGDGAERTSW